jgi:hypothetical protein
MIAYETQLNQDFRWALQEGCMHFEEASAVHRTLRQVVKQLDELGVRCYGFLTGRSDGTGGSGYNPGVK